MKRGQVEPQRTQRAQRDTKNFYSLCLSVLSVSSVVKGLDPHYRRPATTAGDAYARDDTNSKALPDTTARIRDPHAAGPDRDPGASTWRRDSPTPTLS